MTLTLNKVTTAPVQVSAAQDDVSIRKAMDTFVTAYNDLNKLLAEQTKYDAGSKTAGGAARRQRRDRHPLADARDDRREQRRLDDVLAPRRHRLRRQARRQHRR